MADASERFAITGAEERDGAFVRQSSRFRDWITDDGFLPNQKFIDYARPLIVGEVNVPQHDGLPLFARLSNKRIPATLPARAKAGK